MDLSTPMRSDFPWALCRFPAGAPRGRSWVRRGGARGCAAGPADSPRISRGFSADFPRVPLGGPRIFRGCKCTTLPGKTMKRHPRIFRGWSRAVLGSTAGSRGSSADFPRVPRILRGFSAGAPAGLPRISTGAPRSLRGRKLGEGVCRLGSGFGVSYVVGWWCGRGHLEVESRNTS
jgi:hypothetical protein